MNGTVRARDLFESEEFLRMRMRFPRLRLLLKEGGTGRTIALFMPPVGSDTVVWKEASRDGAGVISCVSEVTHVTTVQGFLEDFGGVEFVSAEPRSEEAREP